MAVNLLSTPSAHARLNMDGASACHYLETHRKDITLKPC